MSDSHIVDDRPLIFTAQSKEYFYCRDAVCEFVFRQGAVPLNPFRAFGYFLSDRVERDEIRIANNNLLRVADELWVFGKDLADGVLFEIDYAAQKGKPVRFFSIHNLAERIRELPREEWTFEAEVRHKSGNQSADRLRENLSRIVQGRPLQNERLFPSDALDL